MDDNYKAGNYKAGNYEAAKSTRVNAMSSERFASEQSTKYNIMRHLTTQICIGCKGCGLGKTHCHNGDDEKTSCSLQGCYSCITRRVCYKCRKAVGACDCVHSIICLHCPNVVEIKGLLLYFCDFERRTSCFMCNYRSSAQFKSVQLKSGSKKFGCFSCKSATRSECECGSEPYY
jgi:hypothetical protein